MICITGNNIISSLGFTTGENYGKVQVGISGVRRYSGLYGIPEPFMAALIEDKAPDGANHPDEFCSPLEQTAILSIRRALQDVDVDPAHPRTLFVFSSTKGNVEYLATAPSGAAAVDNRLYLWHTAQRIAHHFSNPNIPVVVSNACISGAYAMLVAKRELEAGRYDSAVVVGADHLSKFIVSGFQSFKALSGGICKPFDALRDGLNLGEAAATVILQKKAKPCGGDTVLAAGAACNDANHISGPSRTGEGLYLALSRIMRGRNSSDIAFINAHGTATLYNDEMEAIALHRAGLDAIPVNGLKACLGHTLGAAGIVESIISATALQHGTILKTTGYSSQGTSYPLPVTTENIPTEKNGFIKMLSGFGGCNIALLFEKV
ncbi:MAG: beta-ketoacyl synthase [Bacteroidales bacterium]|jgi:3-oxoacyl-[acyl-carrier-protein] synthase-1|nr:beta-ketoacyl synthase [Bacteroidales bacterium]